MIQQRKKNAWKMSMGGLSTVCVGACLTSCGGNFGFHLPTDAATASATLSGSQVVPSPVSSQAMGTVRVTVAANRASFTIKLNTSNLDQVTDAAIRAGDTTTNGPVLFSLYTPAEGIFPSMLTKTLTQSDFKPPSTSGVATFADVIQLLTGSTSRVPANSSMYFSVRTKAHPSDEIRGDCCEHD